MTPQKTMLSAANPCPVHGHRHTVEVATDGVAAWLKGVPIQVAFPDLGLDERETLLSGFCSTAWDQLTDTDPEDDPF